MLESPFISSLDVSCVVPSQFAASADRYAQKTCTSKFGNVIQGQMPAAQAGIRPTQPPPAPTGNDTAPTNPFEMAMRVMADIPPSGARAAPMDPPESPAERLIPGLYFQLCLTLLGFAIAICFARIAKSHSCFLNVAWRNAITGEGAAGGQASEGKGALLDKSDILGSRMSSLMSTKTLAIGYLVFTVILLIIWFAVGMGMYHGACQIDDKVEEIAEMKEEMIKKYMQMKQMQAMIAAGQPLPPGTPAIPMPPPTHASGEFMCDFSLNELGSEQEYTVQCSYDVSREGPAPPTPPMDPTPLLMAWRMVVRENMMLCVLLAVLLVIHVVAMYVFGPLSRQRSIALILMQLGAKPKVLGLKFALTDLSFIAAFTNLGDNNGYLVTSTASRSNAIELNHHVANHDDAEGEKHV